MEIKSKKRRARASCQHCASLAAFTLPTGARAPAVSVGSSTGAGVASSGGAGSSSGAGQSRASETSALLSRLATALEHIEPTDEAKIVTIGARKVPEEIGHANNTALRSGTVRQGQQEALGMRN